MWSCLAIMIPGSPSLWDETLSSGLVSETHQAKTTAGEPLSSPGHKTTKPKTLPAQYW